jgi:LPS-assembly lipoprotein
MRRRLLVAALGLGLAGCGFRLRGEQAIALRTIYLAVPPNSPVGAEIARNLRAAGDVTLVNDRKQAQGIVELLGETRDREVLAVNAQGRAREFTLRLSTRFRVVAPDGTELLAPTTLSARRDISINDADILAREQEEGLLYRDMQSDIVRQMINRIAAIRPDAT